MKKHFMLFFGFIVFVCCDFVLAKDCNQIASQSDMNICFREEYVHADKKLNELYVSYRNKLSSSKKQRFQEIQRVWIKFRDMSCEFEASNSEGGSAHSMAFSACLTERTLDRIEEIQRLNSCEEGDLTCP